MVESVSVTAVGHPFRTQRMMVELPVGGLVADMICALGLDPAIPARIFVDDRIVMAGERKRIRPKPGQTLTVRALPTGGNRNKDVELITIAVAAVAAAVTAGVGAAIIGPGVGASAAGTASTASAATAAGGSASAAASGISWSLIAEHAAVGLLQGALGEAIKFGGSQLINALIPPPRTPVPKQETTPQSYTVSGTANAAAPFAPIPKIYGARRIFPQYAASPYNELAGFDQYLRMLFLPGYGPLDISQIKIGDTAIEDYEDVEWELRAGFPDDAPTRLYPGSVSEAALNIQLSKTNGGGLAPTVYDWTQVPVQTSGTNADELGADVSFPGGLSAFAKSSGSYLLERPWK